MQTFRLMKWVSWVLNLFPLINIIKRMEEQIDMCVSI